MQITTSTQAAARDADAIASGVESFALMHAAGTAAGEHIALLATTRNASAIFVWAGPGNNGGDAYVVAEYLYNHCTIPTVLHETAPPKSDDARHARELCLKAREHAPPQPDVLATNARVSLVLVDGILGTGQQGELRADVRALCAHVPAFRAKGGVVVSLDLPTGVNATTGEIAEGAIQADVTLAFGTVKRAHVLQRAQCGEIIVLDIGLGACAEKNDGAWTLADAASLSKVLPDIAWNAHKGTRGRVAIVGGSLGMAGAIVLASQAALHAGAGLVHTYTHEASVLPLQISIPQAIAHTWSSADADNALAEMRAIAIGPGLGRGNESADFLDQLLHNPSVAPLVLDADALTLLATDPSRLRALTATRAVICTPHVGEFARLLGKTVAEHFEDRVAQAREFVDRTGVTLLLKGTPTVIVAPDDVATIIVARGTSVLATGGSGDMLTGIIGALLAQGARAADAASIAAWVHGRAAEIATRNAGAARGVTLQQVMQSFAAAWRELETPSAAVSEFGNVLTQLPAV